MNAGDVPNACKSHAQPFGAVSGGRLRNTWATDRGVGDNRPKGWLIPHTIVFGQGKRANALCDGPAAHQVVGGVTAHQADDGFLV